MDATSADGIEWTAPSPALNPSGTNSNFDFSNLNAPDVLRPGRQHRSVQALLLGQHGRRQRQLPHAHRLRDVAERQLVLQGTNGTGVNPDNSVLDVGTLSTASTRARHPASPSWLPASATPKHAGFYWGTRGSDFKPRLGAATSPDGSAWSKVAGSEEGGALLAARQPGPRSTTAGSATPARSTTPGPTSCTSPRSTPRACARSAVRPRPRCSRRISPITRSGAPQRAAAGRRLGLRRQRRRPSVGDQGRRRLRRVLHGLRRDHAGDRPGELHIARAHGRGARRLPRLAGSAGTFDEDGVKDPVVLMLGAGDYRMLYTGVETLADGRRSSASATPRRPTARPGPSSGVVLNPSLRPMRPTRPGVQATGLVADGPGPRCTY